MIVSPLTGKTTTKLVRKLDIRKIVQQYRNEYNIDVEKYFSGINQIEVYKCEESGLEFYYPFHIIGDERFYESLSKNYQNYYSKWKWEHEEVYQYIQAKDKVLEVGCGKGFYLKKILDKGAMATGLDFNPDAVQYGEEQGISILAESIHDHANNKIEEYDIVCSFQLLEHINDAKIFIEDMLKSLKKGGLLTIGVPNNDSFLFKEDHYHTLNTPPHHMLLWNKESLTYIAHAFNLSLVSLNTQPTNTINRSMIYKLWLNKYFGKNIITKAIWVASRWFVKRISMKMEGATVVAVYKKQ